MSIDTALRLLVRSVSGPAGRRLALALSEAYSSARASLESDLRRAHLPELEGRHAELAGYLGAAGSVPILAPDTWLLVLSHLAPEMQRLLQATYDDLQRVSDAAPVGDRDELSHVAQRVSLTLAAAEDVLAELPHTSLERSGGPDSYELLRRTLSIEIDWEEPGDEDGPACPLRVGWRDGYETLIADMAGIAIEADFCWTLEVHDPAPGRSATRLSAMQSGDARDAAVNDLQGALAWANRELGDRYIRSRRTAAT